MLMLLLLVLLLLHMLLLLLLFVAAASYRDTRREDCISLASSSARSDGFNLGAPSSSSSSRGPRSSSRGPRSSSKRCRRPEEKEEGSKGLTLGFRV